MMSAWKIIDYVTAEPFRPFRIRMTSGEIYEIRYPEFVHVGKNRAMVFALAEGDKPGSQDKWHHVSILQIESLEPLEAAVNQQST